MSRGSKYFRPLGHSCVRYVNRRWVTCQEVEMHIVRNAVIKIHAVNSYSLNVFFIAKEPTKTVITAVADKIIISSLTPSSVL